MRKPLPSRLNEAYEWINSASEWEAALSTPEEYARGAAANAAEHGKSHIGVAELLEVIDWAERESRGVLVSTVEIAAALTKAGLSVGSIGVDKVTVIFRLPPADRRHMCDVVRDCELAVRGVVGAEHRVYCTQADDYATPDGLLYRVYIEVK